MNKGVSAVDLFCGAGGLTHGLERAGIGVNLGVDIDPACKYPYTANNYAKFLLRSVADVRKGELIAAYPDNDIKILAGCAPCQPFSVYNKSVTLADKRPLLLFQFARLILEVRPEIVIMENVPGLIGKPIFKSFVGEIKKKNYYVDYNIVSCAEYGVPQERKRLILLASRLGPIKLLAHHKGLGKPRTVRDAIGHLPPIKAGEIHESDPLHQSSSLSDLNYQRILASKPGGTWLDWPDDLFPNCQKKSVNKSYLTVYGRMSWNKPAPTITTRFLGFSNGRFGHPDQNRAISLREGAVLQTFPKEYEFVAPGETISKAAVGRLIGNAVPVKLGEIIGQRILKHLAEVKNEKS